VKACGCSPLCDRCIADKLGHLAGVAQCRGEVWSRAVADRIGITQPWPRTAKARSIALGKVADLARDERLRERLADQLELGAARWWDRQR